VPESSSGFQLQLFVVLWSGFDYHFLVDPGGDLSGHGGVQRNIARLGFGGDHSDTAFAATVTEFAKEAYRARNLDDSLADTRCPGWDGAR